MRGQVKELVREGGARYNPNISSLETLWCFQRLWWYGWGWGSDSWSPTGATLAWQHTFWEWRSPPYANPKLHMELDMTANRLYIAMILDKLKNLSQKIISKFISHSEIWLAMKKDSGAIRQPTPSQAPFNTAPLPCTSWDPGQVTSPPSTSLSSGRGTLGGNYIYSVYLNRVPNTSERIQTREDKSLPE